jgi:uncharacterized protein
MNKIYFTYQEIHKLVNKIALDIKNDNWIPDCIVAIATGGFIPSRIIRNYINRDIYVVGLKRYEDENEQHSLPVKFQWLDDVDRKISGKNVLLVDEIDDTRVTLSYCVEELMKHHPKDIRIAIIHQKKKEKLGVLPDDIKIYQGNEVGDVWIKYPWDTQDIDDHYSHCDKK